MNSPDDRASAQARRVAGVRRRKASTQQTNPRNGSHHREEYLVTFPAGLAALVEECLRADLRRVSVRHRDDSALLFSSTTPAEGLARLPYVKNVFQLILEVPRSSLGGAAKTIGQQLQRSVPPGLGRLRDFRVMAQIDGQLQPLDRHAKESLERAVTATTRARVNARGGGDELWLIGRRDLPTIVFARRLSRAAKAGPAGSLSPELSQLLVRISKPESKDVFLDPFAGSGALCRARAASPARRVIGSDLYTDPRLEGVRTATPMKVLHEDALELPSVRSGSVSVVVTDPPWGEFEALDRPTEEFYAAMVASFRRVLDPEVGRLVLLVSRQMEELVVDHLRRGGFDAPRLVPVLVNGHPATVVYTCRMEGGGHDG